MIGTARVTADAGAPLRGLPVATYPSHMTAPKGSRIVVGYLPPTGKPGEPGAHPIFDGLELGWLLVRWGDKMGWVEAKDVARNPLVFVDLSHYNGKVIDFARVIEDGYAGVTLKATQGVYYSYAPWYMTNVARARAAAGDRFGDTFFVQAFHYWTKSNPGAAQALYHLHVLRAGRGLSNLTLRPVLDVERGGGNDGVTKKELLLSVQSYIDTIFKETGQRTIIYGGELLRSLKIVASDFMTHAVPVVPDLWFAHYGPDLEADKICAPLGVDPDDGFAWQYAASADTKTPTTPNYGKLPHGIVGLDVDRPTVRQLCDTDIVLGAGDCVELVAKYGWH